jgi:lipopolysaccharide export system permease protein
LPLLALPLGMASKRGRRTPGVVFGVLALLAIDHSLQFGESLADTGRLPAALAVWTPFVAFAALSIWIFRSSLAWPGDNPVLRAVVAIENWIDRTRSKQRARSAP